MHIWEISSEMKKKISAENVSVRKRNVFIFGIKNRIMKNTK